MENQISPELDAALNAWLDKRSAAREKYMLASRRFAEIVMREHSNSTLPDEHYSERSQRFSDQCAARVEYEKLKDFPWDIVGLGTRSDMKIALELGYGVKTVSMQRRRRGIPAFNAPHGGQP